MSGQGGSEVDSGSVRRNRPDRRNQNRSPNRNIRFPENQGNASGSSRQVPSAESKTWQQRQAFRSRPNWKRNDGGVSSYRDRGSNNNNNSNRSPRYTPKNEHVVPVGRNPPVDKPIENQETASTLNVHAEVFTPGNRNGAGRAERSRSRRWNQDRQRQEEPLTAGDCSRTEESKSQKESLEEQLMNENYDCCICCNRVRAHHKVYNCQKCFILVHLDCIVKWASTSVEGSWRCIVCNFESSMLPKDYYCFCGKQRNPTSTKGALPHSCKRLCSRQRDCPHKCNKICHPGRCPTCEATVNKACSCGKTKFQMKCDTKLVPKCDQSCGKLLSCFEHTCNGVCHSGECPPCDVKKTISCKCRKQSKQVECSNAVTFDCEQVCDKPLACGNHKCQVVCHSGPCEPCVLADLKTCPCGMTAISSDWNCSKPVPLCGLTCRRKLECGHKCEEDCHLGECPSCKVIVKGRRCACDHIVEEAECGEKVLKCKRKCQKKKHCSRHKCLESCCDKEIHICDLTCAKKLSCNLHFCSLTCHKGPCQKCDNVSWNELSCHCGYTTIVPPVPCNQKPPACTQLCQRQHRCNHPVTHPCHSDDACPPCTSLTEKVCHGEHEIRRNIPCYLENVSCGKQCGKPLSCGRHKCDKNCHAGPCPSSCTQPCSELRKCGHRCKLPCHDECPPSTCFERVDLTCSCGRLVEARSCHLYQQAINGQFQQRIKRGEDVKLANNIIKLAKGFLKCDEQCAVVARSRRLAEGFQVDPENTTFTNTNYSDFVKQEAKKNWTFCSKIVQKLNSLVELAKSSPQESRSFSFDPMTKDQRRFIYELIQNYRCTGTSYDQEPKRNVVVTAYREKSAIPTKSLASVVGYVNLVPLKKL